MNINKFIMIKSKTSNHLFKLVLGGFFAKRGPNRLWIQMVLYIITVMCLLSGIFSASAGGFVESLTDGVESGLNAWIVGICDSVYAIGVDETNMTNTSPISEEIFRTATYTYNPFENSGVQDIAEWSVTLGGRCNNKLQGCG